MAMAEAHDKMNSSVLSQLCGARSLWNSVMILPKRRTAQQSDTATGIGCATLLLVFLCKGPISGGRPFVKPETYVIRCLAARFRFRGDGDN